MKYVRKQNQQHIEMIFKLVLIDFLAEILALFDNARHITANHYLNRLEHSVALVAILGEIDFERMPETATSQPGSQPQIILPQLFIGAQIFFYLGHLERREAEHQTSRANGLEQRVGFRSDQD